MTNEVDEFEVFTTYEFQLRLNPLKWLAAVFNALWQVFIIPSRIVKLITTTGQVFGALFKNKNITFFTKFIVTTATTFNVLFFMIPRVFVYPAVKLALVCVLVEFRIRRFVKKLESGEVFDGLKKPDVDALLNNLTDFKEVNPDDEVK